MVKKINITILVLSIVFITSCSTMSEYMTSKDNKGELTLETVVLEINGQEITKKEFEDVKNILLIQQKITEKNIEALNQSMKREKDQNKIKIYQEQIKGEQEKLISNLDNLRVAEEIINNIILYEEAIAGGQAIGPNKAKAIVLDIKSKYDEKGSESKRKVLDEILKDLDISQDYYWEELEPKNVMYKNSINNLRVKLATEYIENNFKNEKAKPSYQALLKDKNFLEYYNSFKESAFKKSSIRVRKGYI